MIKKPFIINNKAFDNKTQAKEFMKARLSLIAIGQEIGPENPDFYFFKDLYETHHYGISKGYTVLKIRKYPDPGYNTGYELQVFVKELNRWQGASYLRCFNAPTWKDHFKKALRLYFEENIRTKVQKTETCMAVSCIESFYLVYHHHSPTFEDMIEQILPLFTAEEQEHKFGYAWKNEEKFRLPEQHISTAKLAELHDGSKYAWLCKPHHKAAHNKDSDLEYKILELRL